MSSPPIIPTGGGPLRQRQVSLRGASTREMSRDALLQKLSEEREIRNHDRRASAAALSIQQVWRRYCLVRHVAEQYQQEWEYNLTLHDLTMNTRWISNNLLRPFLFFTSHATRLHQKLKARDIKCIRLCFESLLQSINSPDPDKNYCSMALGTPADRATWVYQIEKLAALCLFLLAESNSMCQTAEEDSVTALGMRLLISLTDVMSWRCIEKRNAGHCAEMIKKLLIRMATGKILLYTSVRKYILNQVNSSSLSDKFLITTSAITLLLRPFHAKRLGVQDLGDLELMHAAEDYCKFILTIPHLLQRLPLALLPALKHKSSLSPCLKVLSVAKVKVLAEMLGVDSSNTTRVMNVIPSVGWVLSNVIELSTDSSDSGNFIQGLDHQLYVRAVCCLSECCLDWVDNVDRNKDILDDTVYKMSVISSVERVPSDADAGATSFGAKTVSFMGQLAPVHQQWHLRSLLGSVKDDKLTADMKIVTPTTSTNLELFDIVSVYSNMLRIYQVQKQSGGCLSLLNMLSFTPGFLPVLWKNLEGYFLGLCLDDSKNSLDIKNAHHLKHGDHRPDNKIKGVLKDAGDKWVHVFHKISGRSSDMECSISSEDTVKYDPVGNENSCSWEIKYPGHGLQGIPKEILSLLHLFFAVYAHLLLVLDDLDFYEKQVPFTIVQQQQICSVLNSLVYRSFLNSDHKKKPLVDVAVQCLHLLYQRDCRHRFCPDSLWLEPAKNNRLPVAAAARAHEVASTSLHSGDVVTPVNSIITTMPHVFPFEERVQMFRDFIKLDKASRRVAGEVDSRRLGSIEIVIRRSHMIEDAYRQLHSLGSKLKSNFNVSFVSDGGLPEVGLDYGGLSKEFLTDLAKSAFDPQYGLFIQTCTPERFLFPNITAKFMDNGLDMIEFLGRIVGKALYEGILLDYSFSLAFVQKLLGRYSYLDELSTLDPELYKNLMYVKHYDGNIEDLSLDFTVTEEIYGKRVVTELKPGGKDVAVTNDNKLQYVYAMSDYQLNRQIFPLANAFVRGLSDLIAPSWLRLFNGNEFNQLLSGGKFDLDVEDLKKNTRYTGGYTEGSRTVKLFWEVMRGFTPEERCLLLKFTTSCSRGPLLGFNYLQPIFTIHKVVCDLPIWALIGGQDVDRLPTASTCYNTLKLPTYKKQSTLRSKLLYAISSNTGFELS